MGILSGYWCTGELAGNCVLFVRLFVSLQWKIAPVLHVSSKKNPPKLDLKIIQSDCFMNKCPEKPVVERGGKRSVRNYCASDSSPGFILQKAIKQSKRLKLAVFLKAAWLQT